MRSAPASPTTMMIPIGNAVSLPPIPTTGAITAPEIREKKPINAAAPPALFPCFCIAREKLADPIADKVDTVIKIVTAITNSGAYMIKPANKTRLPEKAAVSATRKSFHSAI